MLHLQNLLIIKDYQNSFTWIMASLGGASRELAECFDMVQSTQFQKMSSSGTFLHPKHHILGGYGKQAFAQ